MRRLIYIILALPIPARASYIDGAFEGFILLIYWMCILIPYAVILLFLYFLSAFRIEKNYNATKIITYFLAIFGFIFHFILIVNSPSISSFLIVFVTLFLLGSCYLIPKIQFDKLSGKTAERKLEKAIQLANKKLNNPVLITEYAKSNNISVDIIKNQIGSGHIKAYENFGYLFIDDGKNNEI